MTENKSTMDQISGLDELIQTTARPLHHHEDVLLLHQKFDLPRPSRPQLMEPAAFEFRKKFLVEELDEFIKAHNEGNLEDAADGLVDLVYVAIGTAIFMGLPWQELWNEVHRANMSKERGTNAKRGSFNADLIKPEGWKGPDLKKVLLQWVAFIDKIEGETE